MRQTQTGGRIGRRAALGGVAALALVLASCFGMFSRPREKVKPQQWDSSRGPVVPHDTFPTDCTLCHEGKDWHSIRKDFVFDHAKQTGTALAGAHTEAECLRCHNDRGPVARFSKRGCSGCHEDVHRGALDRNCSTCHSEATWQPGGVFAQHAQTRFPLSGAHIAVACFRCHKESQVGNFRDVSPRCEACHQADLARATQPNHALMGITSDCQRCHKPVAWTGATFNHAGIVTGCITCHQADFNLANTKDPNHAANPTSCETCHSTGSWSGGAPLNHTFNIKSGKHAGMSCNQCHLVPNNYALASCIHCHPHSNKTETDGHHSGMQNYSYTNTACINCHPTGKAD